jgi:hypothetical protein
MSDISSVDGNEKPLRKPFIPYRIDPHNMNKMNSLFEEGYEAQLVAALPRVGGMSKYGFSHEQPHQNEDDMLDEDIDVDSAYYNQIYEGKAGGGIKGKKGILQRVANDSDDDDDDDDDDDSDDDSTSFDEEEAAAKQREDDHDDEMSLNSSIPSFNSFNQHPHRNTDFGKHPRKKKNKVEKVAGTKRKLQSKSYDTGNRNSFEDNVFLRKQEKGDDDNDSSSTISSKQLLPARNDRERERDKHYKNSTYDVFSSPQQQQQQRPKTSAVIIEQEINAKKKFSSPFKLGSINENRKGRKPVSNDHDNEDEDEDDALSIGSLSGTNPSMSNYSGSGSLPSTASQNVFQSQSLDRFPQIASSNTPHRVIHQLRGKKKQEIENPFLQQRPLTHQGHHHHHHSGKKKLTSDEPFGSSPKKSGFESFFAPPPRSNAQTAVDIYTNKKFSSSILFLSGGVGGGGSYPTVNSSIDQMMSEIDPFTSAPIRIRRAVDPSLDLSDSPGKAATGLKEFSMKIKARIRPDDSSSKRANDDDDDDDIVSEVDPEEKGYANQDKKSKRKRRKAGEEDDDDEEDEDYIDSSDEEMNQQLTHLVETEYQS